MLNYVTRILPQKDCPRCWNLVMSNVDCSKPYFGIYSFGPLISYILSGQTLSLEDTFKENFCASAYQTFQDWQRLKQNLQKEVNGFQIVRVGQGGKEQKESMKTSWSN